VGEDRHLDPVRRVELHQHPRHVRRPDRGAGHGRKLPESLTAIAFWIVLPTVLGLWISSRREVK